MTISHPDATRFGNPGPASPSFDLCVLGLGYIGLPTASVFATKGLHVQGVDVVPFVVDTINQGRNHIEEPELDILVRAAVQSGQMTAALEPGPAAVYIIAVPTPFTIGAGSAKIPDLRHVEAAARSIASIAPLGSLIILESTSPVGTTARVREWFLDERGDADGGDTFEFAHCPERILPGQMIKELVVNDRIVGGLTPGAATRASELYARICTGKIFSCDAGTAELVKLAENAFRDVNIAYANELSMICDKIGLDVWQVIALANRHPRVNILSPGPGVGGHCIAVDPWFIVHAAPEEARLIRAAREVNDSKPEHVLTEIRKAASEFENPRIACLGLTFKANVDDLRESPAMRIVEALASEGFAGLVVADPHVPALPKNLDGRVPLVSWEDAVATADIIVLLVDHSVFRSLPPAVLNRAVLIDTRGMFSPVQ